MFFCDSGHETDVIFYYGEDFYLEGFQLPQFYRHFRFFLWFHFIPNPPPLNLSWIITVSHQNKTHFGFGLVYFQAH